MALRPGAAKMATLNSALQLMSGALAADQSALDVTANNVANANTPGYTREIPIFQAGDSVTINGISYGQGVQMTAAQSQRTLVLDAAIQQQTQAHQASNSEATALTQVEDIFNQVTTSTSSSGVNSLGDQVNNFFNSLSQLAATPSSVSLREGVLTAAGQMSSAFNSAASQLNQQTASLNTQVQGVVDEINPLLTSIAQLNRQISSSSPHADAGSLENQRQYDLQQLSQYVGVNVVANEDNSMTLTTTGGALLLSKEQAFQLTTGNVGGNVDVFTSAPGGASDITAAQANGGGQLAGLLTTRDQDIPSILGQTDTLASAVATQINSIQTSGTDLTGNPGQPLFTLSALDPAATISVALTDPSLIAASATGNGSGDNTNLQAMIHVQNLSSVGGQTPANFYASFISVLGSKVSGLNTQSQAQQASLTQVQSQVSSLSGVSLNEEAASLQNYEQAYQSASQVFGIINTLITSALNLGVQTAVA
jgi:flagellar hook-associated protein 1